MGCLRTLSLLVAATAIAAYGLVCYLAHSTWMAGATPLLTLASHRRFALSDLPNMTGKVVVVTGANTGLGYSSAKALAGVGARTVLACRSASKCAAAADRIRAAHASKPVDLLPLPLDLGSLASVQAFGAQLALATKASGGVDALVLNAGVLAPPRTLTADGLEMQFAVNHVAHAYLTFLAMPLLRKAAASRGSATVVVLSSCFHHFTVPELVHLDEAALNDPAHYDGVLYYGQSKLANILFSNELSRRLSDGAQRIFVNAVHPGTVDTEVSRYLGADVVRLLERLLPVSAETLDAVKAAGMQALAWAADEGALTQLYAAASPQVASERVTGKYLVPVARQFAPSAAAVDPALQAKLWDFTQQVLAQRGFNDYEPV
jgi:NAD(P)-dependent dehydrogenase (short-subunit alcohol dehydrogenase family)